MFRSTSVRFGVLLVFLLALFCAPLHGGGKKKKKKSKPEWQPTYGEALFEGMEYRNIGPFRGGRSAAVTGVPGKPTTFYFGATGGGVWQTSDGGSNWKNISDGFFGGSIGAVAVSTWDPNVIYVGGGEKTVRGNVSHGYGMWRSTDAGRTWEQRGLLDSRHIPRIRIHPRNPDLVYAAVLGHLFGPNEQRGIFRSKDGGQTWEKVLYVNDQVGAVDLVLDPTNPRIMYAGFWRVLRTPYSLESGGEGSGLWKSTDGGDTWNEITRKEGLPQGLIGIVGITVSPANPDRLWTIIEAEDGGVFRSDDAGKTWTKTNENRSLRQRAWYYTRIYADSQDVDTVYVLNVRFWKSKDGGKNFSSIGTPHGDHHDLWIDPDDNRRMVIGDDGGAQVTYDGGNAWSTYHNQPTAQFYRVSTDNHFPYRIYGGQQDNSSVRISHRTEGRAITERDWESSAGGESGHLAAHPENPDIVYGGSYDGLLERYDYKTKASRLVDVWPDNPMGHGAGSLKYRFQWNFPIFFSPHDANTLYTAGNVLFKSVDEGQTWQPISPDLTRNDPDRMGPSGGPITKDNTSVEYYCTIFAAVESHHEAGTLWAGSDDGLVHISRDGGANWENVTPPDLSPWTQINSVEIHPFEKGGLYFAGTRYKSDDFAPYLFRTLDYGKTWTAINTGINPTHFTRVIRADPGRKGLLYAGTESGMYVSFDDGTHWQPFQLNLPIVPITDLAIKNNDLVVATQGRSFWVLDDLTPLHQMTESHKDQPFTLYQPRPSWRIGGSASTNSGNNGTNLPGGVLVHFYLPEDLKEASGDGENKQKAQHMSLTIMEEDETVIREFSTEVDGKDDEEIREPLKVKKGFNRFVWNLRYRGAEDFPGMILWSGNMSGPRALPGNYKARLTLGEEKQTVAFEVVADPRSTTSMEGLRAQFDFVIEVRDKLTQAHKALAKIRSIKAQVDHLIKPMKDEAGLADVVEAAKALKERLITIEENLYQTKNKSRQDPLNYPIRLTDKLAGVKGVSSRGDFPPTAGAIAVKDELVGLIDGHLSILKNVLDEDLKAFNDLVKSKNVPAIRNE